MQGVSQPREARHFPKARSLWWSFTSPHRRAQCVSAFSRRCSHKANAVKMGGDLDDHLSVAMAGSSDT